MCLVRCILWIDLFVVHPFIPSKYLPRDPSCINTTLPTRYYNHTLCRLYTHMLLVVVPLGIDGHNVLVSFSTTVMTYCGGQVWSPYWTCGRVR